jgi:hypothetical protein
VQEPVQIVHIRKWLCMSHATITAENPLKISESKTGGAEFTSERLQQLTTENTRTHL